MAMRSFSPAVRLGIFAAAAVVACTAWWIVTKSDRRGAAPGAVDTAIKQPLQVADAAPPANAAEPATDRPIDPGVKPEEAPGPKFAGPGTDVGRAPVVPADTNVHTRSIAEALQSRTHPERLSPSILPAVFNAKAFAADPATYLNTVEPGRIYQVAQPGSDVPQLFPVGESYHQIKQGQSAVLKAQSAPGSPVTFTSFDMGEFENRLTSITVKADERGVAQATFTGSGGTYNYVNILAGSPQASGQAKFTVFVEVAASK